MRKELRLQDVNFNFIEDVANDLTTLCRELMKLNKIMGGDSLNEKAIRTAELLKDDLDCVLDVKDDEQ